MSESGDWLHTSIGRATPDSITVRGQDLAGELMGKMSFGDLAFLIAAGRQPTEGESQLFNAVLISLADHGLTPTALAARLTYTGAPEAVQGAIASGLLGAGSVFLGPVGDTVGFLADIIEHIPTDTRSDEAALRAAATESVRVAVADGRRIPGLGHPIHREVDPRTPRLYQLAKDNDLLGPHLRLLDLLAAEHRAATGKSLPINGAGAAGAALADMGFPRPVAHGFALLSRTAGLVGHLAEEAADPIGMRLWKEVDTRASAADETQDE